MYCLMKLLGVVLLIMSGFINSLTASQGSVVVQRPIAPIQRSGPPQKPVPQLPADMLTKGRPVGVKPMLPSQSSPEIRQSNRLPKRPMPPPPSKAPNRVNMGCLDTNKSPIVILSIDGAAVRGLAQLIVIKSLIEAVNKEFIKDAQQHPEKYKPIQGTKFAGFETKPKDITDIFDFIVGTSAGSINTIGLTTPADYRTANVDGKKAKPKFSLDDLLNRSVQTAKTAFSSSFWRNLRVVYGLMGSQFSAKPLAELLQELTGESRISDAVIPIAITSFDLVTDQPVIFSTFDVCSMTQNHLTSTQASGYTGGEITTFQPTGPEGIRDFSRHPLNVHLWEAGLASGSAPVYFKPYVVNLGGRTYHLIDAGLFIMNPAELALLLAQLMYPGRRYILISIGSGKLPEVPQMQVTGPTAGSVLKVLERTITTSLTGDQALTDWMMRQREGVKYHRINFGVENNDFSDISEKNIESIVANAYEVPNTPEFKAAANDVYDARREREEKNDLAPFICEAKANQMRLDKLESFGTPRGQTHEKAFEDVRQETEYLTQQLKENVKPVPADLQEQINKIRAECQRLKLEKKTAEYNQKRCEYVLKDIPAR